MQKLISILILSLLALLVSSEEDHHDSQAIDSCLVNNHYGSHEEEEHEEEDDISCPLESIQENGIQQLYAQNPSGEKINLNIKKGTDLLIDGASVSGSLNTNATNISTNTTAIAAIGSDLNAYKASANSQMNYMKSDYSSGIASAVAMSQFNLAQDGFSIGVGRGSYNDEDETAFGLGYGGEFKNGTLFKLQASKSGDASGVGLTISF